MTEALSDPWDGDRVARWVRQSDALEVQLLPVADALFEAVRLVPGESVLDVGCGTGPTTRRAAAVVGTGGVVTGIDVAAEMLEAASETPAPPASASIDWVHADVVEWTPPRAAFDVVLSRFGVMFFSDPTRAFANLSAATRPGGRLAMATWARRDESELFAVPLHAALAGMDQTSTDLPDDEGPFSLPDQQTITELLESAGWRDVRTEVRHLDLLFGGGIDPAAAALAALDFGPTRLVTEEVDDEVRGDVVGAITQAFTDHVDERGHVVLGGAVLITTARASR